MGPCVLGLMLVELRAFAVSSSRPGSGETRDHSSPFRVPLVCEGVSGFTFWLNMNAFLAHRV